MTSKKTQRHITQNPDGTWNNKKANSERASSVHDTQQEAFEAAREQAKKQGNTEIKIHGRNGKIRESNTYNKEDDPKNIKG